MKKIEDLIADKICELAAYILSKRIHPDIKIDKVTDLSREEIRYVKQRYNLEGVILDIDDTLRKDMRKIPKCNEEWLNMIKQELKVIVVSNGNDKKIEEFFKEKDIDYIGFAHKPLKRNFIKACERLKIQPENVLVVGDSLFDDIYGGKRNKMKTALVKEVDEEER